MIHLFLGPTLPASEAARALPGAIVHPPIKAGDLIRLDPRSGDVVAIVDGYFHHVAAVRHQEIMAALAVGVAVYGAASIGALRAAELHEFGMVGIGEVYELYASGTIDGDDEVAVAHLGADAGYRPLSEALVDIRRHCRDACAAGVLGSATATAIIAAARELPYDRRTYPEVLRRAGAPDEALLAFVHERGRSAKREDARLLLRRLFYTTRQRGGPRREFAPTRWHSTASERRRMSRGPDGVGVNERVVLEFLRVIARDYPDWHERVALAELARIAPRTRGYEAVSADKLGEVQAANDLGGDSLLAAQMIREDELRACLERRRAAPSSLAELRDAAAKHAIAIGLWSAAGPPPEVARMWLTDAELAKLGPVAQAARIAVRTFAYAPGTQTIAPFVQELKLSGAFAAVSNLLLQQPPIWHQRHPGADVTAWCARRWGVDQITPAAILDRGLAVTHLCQRGRPLLDTLARRAAPFYAAVHASGPYPDAPKLVAPR